MASPQSEAINVLYNGWLEAMAAKPDMDLDEMRDLFEHWGDITGEPGSVDYTEIDAGGVEAMWAVPHGCADDRVALCTHGGGYVCGSMYTHRKMFGHIAKAIGFYPSDDEAISRKLRHARDVFSLLKRGTQALLGQE